MAMNSVLTVRSGSLDATSMRYHELALQAWLYSKFFVREGYSVPVVFGTPMDAYSKFKDLWGRKDNPFAYLFDLKDANGTPLYEPHPSVPRYPLISVMRKGWKYRQYQNVSIHSYRPISWVTVSKDVKREDLGTAVTSRRPMAWDYRFQIDFYSTRPDTQAFFVETMMRQFWRTGGTPQTWTPVNYPGIGPQNNRIYLADESIDWQTPDVPDSDRVMEYRTTVNIIMEGYSLDLDYQFAPALWTLLDSGKPGTVDELSGISPAISVDLRIGNNNPDMVGHADIPANGTGTVPVLSTTSVQFVSFGTGTPESADPTFVPPAAYSYGVPSSEAFGIPTVVHL